MSVKRYEWVACDEHSCHCDVVESVDGDMVDYEDYAALEQKLAESQREFRAADATIENLQMKLEKMAAELQSVKAMNDCLSEELRGYESDGAFEGPKMHLLWWQCETPNHDAFLAEVRAQGVEMFSKAQEKIADEELIGGNFDLSLRFRGMSNAATEFAAQLRKGVQS
jgi:predicted nuclease with TOPRIM domain